MFAQKNRPILTLHVRLGDACTDPDAFQKGRTCLHLDDYMPYVDEMIEKYGFRSVFLATDSPAVIANATSQYPHISWLWSNVNRTMLDAPFKPGSQFHSIEDLVDNRAAAFAFGASPVSIFDQEIL